MEKAGYNVSYVWTVYLSDVSSNLLIVAQLVVISHDKCGLRHLYCKTKSTKMEFGGPEFYSLAASDRSLYKSGPPSLKMREWRWALDFISNDE